jgi:hypothetical protein
LGGYIAGVSLLSDRPDPTSGTPDGWYVAVENPSSSTVTATSYAVCTTPTGSANSKRPGGTKAGQGGLYEVVQPLTPAECEGPGGTQKSGPSGPSHDLLGENRIPYGKIQQVRQVPRCDS